MKSCKRFIPKTQFRRRPQPLRGEKPAGDVMKMRPCLGDCGKEFMTWPGKRICPGCTTSNELLVAIGQDDTQSLGNTGRVGKDARDMY